MLTLLIALTLTQSTLTTREAPLPGRQPQQSSRSPGRPSSAGLLAISAATPVVLGGVTFLALWAASGFSTDASFSLVRGDDAPFLLVILGASLATAIGVFVQPLVVYAVGEHSGGKGTAGSAWLGLLGGLLAGGGMAGLAVLVAPLAPGAMIPLVAVGGLCVLLGSGIGYLVGDAVERARGSSRGSKLAFAPGLAPVPGGALATASVRF